MVKPSWTVVTNLVSKGSPWIGTAWEFFDTELAATECYKQHIILGNCPTKRPYYESVDYPHLGACHRN